MKQTLVRWENHEHKQTLIQTVWNIREQPNKQNQKRKGGQQTSRKSTESLSHTWKVCVDHDTDQFPLTWGTTVLIFIVAVFRLYSYQQCMNVPLIPHPGQHKLSLVLLMLTTDRHYTESPQTT